MSIITTAAQRFNTVTQFGSGWTWTNLSNIPAGGTATANIKKGSLLDTNTVRLQVPSGIFAIPTGAIFKSMKLVFVFSSSQSGGQVTAFAKCNESFETVRGSSSPPGSYVFTADGDKSYWKLLTLGEDEIISKLADGSLNFEVWFGASADTPLPQPDSVRTIDNVSLTITYEVIKGREAATIASFL